MGKLLDNQLDVPKPLEIHVGVSGKVRRTQHNPTGTEITLLGIYELVH